MTDKEKLDEVVKEVANLTIIPNNFTGKGFRSIKNTSRNDVCMAIYNIRFLLKDEINAYTKELSEKYAKEMQDKIIHKYTINPETLEVVETK
jgi:hypothetical protein